MTVGAALQGAWLLVWLVLMGRAWRHLSRLMAHTERVDAGVEDRDPGTTLHLARARRAALVALGWAMLLAGAGPILRNL